MGAEVQADGRGRFWQKDKWVFFFIHVLLVLNGICDVKNKIKSILCLCSYDAVKSWNVNINNQL